MNKYDIKQLCPVPPPYGGVTVHVKRLTERLTMDGLSAGAYYTPECTDKIILQSEFYDLMSWEHSANKVIKLFRHVVRIWKRINEVKPYRVVHSHSSLEDMFLLWIIKNICKKSLVITVHNSMQEEFYRSTNRVNKFFMKRLAKQNIVWIAVSEKAKNEMLKLPLRFKNEIHVIPAYIPVEENCFLPLSDEMQLYLESHSKNIVFYARSFMLHNGIDVYGFDAVLTMYANILKDYNDVGLLLCLAEDSDIPKLETLHSKAKSLRVDDKLFWQIGAIDNMQTLWRQTDIYVRPTNTDGDSLAIREALDMGVKVVASNVCYRPEGTITYQYGNDTDLYEKIKDELGKERTQTCKNHSFYSQIRDIYIELLTK